MHLYFDDYKVNGTGNEEDHVLLRFENEDSNSDEPQKYDSVEDYVQSSRKNAIVDGAQLSESMTRLESNSLSRDLSESTLLESTGSETTSLGTS